MNDPIPQPVDPDPDALQRRNLMLVLVGVGLIATLALVTNLLYQNWWMIQFKLARWRWQRVNQHPDGSDFKFDFDAFVSYSGEDQGWVQDHLMASMEPELSLCLHERDFQIGKSITENIVDCLSRSRCCIVVLSNSYIKSSWCTFEAQVAHSIMKERLVMVILEKDVLDKSLPSSVKALLKTKTFIQWDANDLRFWRRLEETLKKVSLQFNNNFDFELAKIQVQNE